MSVAEMKIQAIEGIMKLNEEKAIQEILNHINSFIVKDDDVANFVFEKTVSKFDKVLEKLS